MRGIEVAAAGRLVREPESRTTKAGRLMVVLSLAVDEGGDETTWLKVLAFEDQAERVASVEKGTSIYVEGRARLEQWTGRDGEARAGLTVMARLAQPMGRIGRRRPKASEDRDRAAPRSESPAEREPFNDPIPF